MYRPHDSAPIGQAPAVALATRPVARLPSLPLAPALSPALSPALPPSRSSLTRPLPDWLHPQHWVTDLAEDIGSRRWYRGLVTLLALLIAALAFWPDLSALQAAPATRIDRLAGQDLHSLAMTLGDGPGSAARTGRPLATPTMRRVAFVPERPRIELTAELPAGDSLERLLQRAGVSGADAARANALVAGAVPLDQLVPGTRVALVLGPRPAPGLARPLERAELRARLDLALAITRAGPGAGLGLERQAIAVDTTPLRVRGQVGESLYRSARAAGVPPGPLQEYLQALDQHLSLDGDVAAEDSFDIVFAFRRAATGETEAGSLIYAGLDRATGQGPRPMLELLRWGQDGGFYSADSLARPVYVQRGGGMITPVNGHLTSLYGQRFHPILGYVRMHAGVDFGAAWGAPIVAAADGVVAYAGFHGGHGLYVRLDHGGGLGTGYGHMSRIAVAPGERVRAGEVIGFVGSSGLSTGPHLHYEMYRNGQTVDPLGAGFTTTTVTRQVDPKDLAAFRARLAQIKALRPGALFAAGARPVQRIAMR